MAVRTRGLDIAITAKRQVADAAARAEAKGVVERWNEQLAASPASVNYRGGIRCTFRCGHRQR
jgi:hypothetical protein